MNTTAIANPALRLAALLGTAAFFAAAPVTVRFEGAAALPELGLAAAQAKGSNSGPGGGDDSSSDDHGGHGGDDSGHDDGGDDDDGDDDDDSGHHGGSAGGGAPAGGGQVAKIETSAGGIEVTYADGSKEEIENGRYERKDSSGRTVEERPATQADIDRLSALF